MNAVNDWPVGRKLCSAFLVLTMLMCGVGLFNYAKLSFLEKSNGWTTHTYEVLDQVQDMSAAVIDQEAGVRGFLVSGVDRFLGPYRYGQDHFQDAFSAARTLTADTASQQQRLDTIQSLQARWHEEVAEKEIGLMASDREAARRIESSGQGKALIDAIRQQVRDMDQAERSLLATRSSSEASAFSSAYLVIVLGSIGFIVLAGGMGLLLTRTIAFPIRAMARSMSRLAAGDLGVALVSTTRKDEIGEMADAVSVFKGNAVEKVELESAQTESRRSAEAEKKRSMETLAQSFESKVGQLVSMLSSSSTELEATAQSMSTTAATTNKTAANVATSADEANIGVQTVAAASEELAASIGEINRQVATSAGLSTRAVESVRRTDETVRMLSDSASRIGDVIGMITAIAGQTNLLALNATIEAARAGEAGRGFAVVASEVKSLAQQTARATDDISSQIAQVQGATQQAVQAIREIGSLIEEVGAITTSIAAAVEEQGAATSEIARNVQQASSNTRDVTSTIAQVSAAANDTGAAASQVLSAAGSLSQQTERLTREVRDFVAGVRVA